MSFFKRLFKRKPQPESPKWTPEEFQTFSEAKDEALNIVLGESFHLVGHAIVPFQVGGAVDMYYYPNYISGTGFATQELIEPDGTGPMPNALGTYEMVAFTKHQYAESEESDFSKIERRFCGIFTDLGSHSFNAQLQPGDTCEIPGEDGENRCLVLDEFKSEKGEFEILGENYGLLLVVEVHRDEMEFSRKCGSDKLFYLLKEARIYPYSDLDRMSVIS